MAKKKAKKEEEEPEVVEIIEARSEEEEEENQVDEEDLPQKWWLEEPWRSLLDPELVKKTDMLKYDLSHLVQQFTDKMLEEDLINFRISGLAIYSAAKMHHWKIKDVIDEEEKIQEEKVRERAKREIPKAMAQPMRQSRKIVTQEELFSSMRDAILETMQKRRDLKEKREKRADKKQKKKVVRSKGTLPKELLKHITGREQTIDEEMNYWHKKIQTLIQLGGKRAKKHGITYEELTQLIEEDEELNAKVKKMESVRMFMVLMFLTSSNKITLEQEGLFKEIRIKNLERAM